MVDGSSCGLCAKVKGRRMRGWSLDNGGWWHEMSGVMGVYNNRCWVIQWYGGLEGLNEWWWGVVEGMRKDGVGGGRGWGRIKGGGLSRNKQSHHLNTM